MSNEWLAVRRVGEWAGLSEELLEEYISIVRPLHNEALRISDDEIKEQAGYFNFLNLFVFSSNEVVEFLRKNGVDDEVVSQFEEGDVPVQQAFQEYSVVDYGLDELVDLIMLIKLFDEHRNRTGDNVIEPLEKAHTLIYLVNHRLSEESSGQLKFDSLGFGMLERTGFRYTFNKKDGYVWSDSLQRDIDRLVAWNVLNKEVIENPETEWDISYSISLGTAAEMFLARFRTKLSNFEGFLLKEWELKQDGVLKDLADTSKVGLVDHLQTISKFNDCPEGRIVLNGRPTRFETNDTVTKEKIDV